MTVTVKYWVGTARHEGKATSYAGAKRIASKNQNAYSPSYYDEKGVELIDDGIGLAYPNPETSIGKSGAQIVRTVYAV